MITCRNRKYNEIPILLILVTTKSKESRWSDRQLYFSMIVHQGDESFHCWLNLVCLSFATRLSLKPCNKDQINDKKYTLMYITNKMFEWLFTFFKILMECNSPFHYFVHSSIIPFRFYYYSFLEKGIIHPSKLSNWF